MLYWRALRRVLAAIVSASPRFPPPRIPRASRDRATYKTEQKLSFNSTDMLDRVACLDDAVQRKAILFGRIGCHENFSLAKARHLAIMGGQLGKERTERFHLYSGNADTFSALGCDSS
jgi:hypothetical protein